MFAAARELPWGQIPNGALVKLQEVHLLVISNW
jgi:hypothetical protein